jgi:hypothetical protein
LAKREQFRVDFPLNTPDGFVLEPKIVISSNKNFVFVIQFAKPSDKIFYFVVFAGKGNIPGMDNHICRRKIF